MDEDRLSRRCLWTVTFVGGCGPLDSSVIGDR